MKKTIFTFLIAAVSTTAGLKAQTIQEGVNHLYADRFKSAISVFEKMLAANPNNAEAAFWLGQVYFDMDDNAKAKQVYQKAMETNGSAPLILVGMGHVDLLENKTGDARQKFEAAITASRGKKGDDPIVQTAIGRANVDAKAGDYNYAIQLLKAASEKDPKNTETLIQLGNAYRKARPGEGGGEAFMMYKKAMEVNPAFAPADLRLAKLFESQKNFEQVLEYLNSAAKRDPKFAPAYYELFYYYFFRTNYAEAETQLSKYVANTDQSWETEYLQAQLFWAKKDYATAISKAEGVVTSNGTATKPRVYRLLTDAYFSKEDYINAKKYSDIFFGKEKAEDITLYDLQLRAGILAKSGGTDQEILNTYLDAAKMDTSANLKVDLVKKGAAFFKEQKKRNYEAILVQKIIELKPKPSINDYFDLTLANYFTPDYAQSYASAQKMIDNFSDQVYGYEWKFNSANAVDTVKKDSIAVPAALELHQFAAKDTAKFRKQYLSSVRFLAAYYVNVAKDKEKATEYFTKWLEVDPANAATITPILEQIKRMPAAGQPATTPRTAPAPKTGTPKPVAATTKPKGKTTVAKTAVAKK
jgi:tetratricopeptide (TPR) repeat protein